MYLNEQITDWEAYIRAAQRRERATLWTMMPATVNKWNYPTENKNTVHAVPSIMGRERQSDGTWLFVPMPEHQDVPVHYLGGGGFYVTHPISQGDEGMLVYASRCIDGFWQSGGMQSIPDYGLRRMHDLSDAIFIPSRLSDANKLSNISQTSCQVRSLDGTQYFEMLPNGGGFNLIMPGGKFVKFTANGDIHATGEIIRGYGTGDQVTVGQHTHNQGDDSHGDTEVPTNPPNAGT